MNTIEKNNLPECISELFEKIQELLRRAELCQYLINNYNVLSDEYLIAGLYELAPNILTEDDYYRIISEYYGKKYYKGPIQHRRKSNGEPMNYDKGYHGPINIRTTLYETVLDEHHEAKDMGVILEVLHTIGVSNVVYYSKERIQKLLDEEKIVILNKKYNPEGAPYIAASPTECPNYERALSDSDYKEFLSSEGKYYETTLKYIKDNISCEKLDRLRNYILTLITNEMERASFLQGQFDERGFQKRIKDLRSKQYK